MKGLKYSEESRVRERIKLERKKKRNGVISIVLLIILVGGSAYFYFTQDEIIEDTLEGLNVQMQKDWVSYEKSIESNEVVIEELNQDEIDATITAYIKSMSLDNKISQLIITTPESLIGISQVVQAGAATKKKILQYPIGGLIFSEINFDTVTQLEEMVNSILIYAPYPILVSINETGATRVENTNTRFSEVNISTIYNGEKLLISNGEKEYELDDLNVSVASSEKEAIDMLRKDVEMLIVESDYEKYHNAIYNAIINGEIDEDIIVDKLKIILEYKITKM